MNLRPKLTYANVVATLALVLVVGGGTVYAAAKLGKNTVTSKAIKKGAVRGSDLHKNAVTSPKVKEGSIAGGDIADGSVGTADLTADVIAGLRAEVTGSATAGPQGGVNTNATVPLPLNGTTSFTPQAGEVTAIAAEARFSIATTNVLNQCSPDVRILIDGRPSRIFISPEDDGDTTTLVQSPGRDASGPFGLINPGVAQTISAELGGDADCTASSQLDRLEVRIVQIR